MYFNSFITKKVKPGNKSPGESITNMQPKHHCSFFNHNFMTSLKFTCSHAIIHVYFSQGRIIKRAVGKLKLVHVYLGRHSFSKMLPS
jgi:hypothetical protein